MSRAMAAWTKASAVEQSLSWSLLMRRLCAAVEAPLLAADARDLHRLRIHDAGAGLGVPTKLLR
jgi:hypothetical protein